MRLNPFEPPFDMETRVQELQEALNHFGEPTPSIPTFVYGGKKRDITFKLEERTPPPTFYEFPMIKIHDKGNQAPRLHPALKHEFDEGNQTFEDIGKLLKLKFKRRISI